MSFTVYPAIDIREGRVVRLNQGDYAQETPYVTDPLSIACDYADAGAAWLHLVDLDAARAGGYTLGGLLGDIKAKTTLRVQTGGGVRSQADVEHLLASGADRVVIGTLAVEERSRVASWIRQYGAARLTIALDVRRAADGRWWPAAHGWTRAGRHTLGDLVRYYSRHGLRHLLCTDISRDGMLSGPNMALYALLREWAPELQLQASGGARDARDVIAVRAGGCAGIVLGRALLEGRVLLQDALESTSPC